MCNTSQEVECVFNEADKHNLVTMCNKKKKFLSFVGDLTKHSQYHPSNDTMLEFNILSMTKEIKEEIDIITLSDLIGSVGGSLGMFFGFSIYSFFLFLIDKIHTQVANRVRAYNTADQA